MNQCSCIINDNFNFVIEYKDKYLLLIDKSEWSTPTNKIALDTHKLTIINGSRKKEIEFRIGGTTIINYCDLPSDNGCGNDGIYQFTIDNCGQIYTLHEAILISIMCSYTKLLVTRPSQDYMEKIFPIFKEIEYVKAFSRIGNTTKALEHYSIIIKMFEHLQCRC